MILIHFRKTFKINNTGLLIISLKKLHNLTRIKKTNNTHLIDVPFQDSDKGEKLPSSFSTTLNKLT